MNNEGKKSRVYGGEKGGIYGGFCSLCGSRIPMYRPDYPHERFCAMCHATLTPWDGGKVYEAVYDDERYREMFRGEKETEKGDCPFVGVGNGICGHCLGFGSDNCAMFNFMKEKALMRSKVNRPSDKTVNTVTVRWFDGYLEEFKCTEVRFGSDLLWMRLVDGKNRHIPLRNVRWFGMSKESHQKEER